MLSRGSYQSKGRTHRNRKDKVKKQKCINISSGPSLVNLVQWMTKRKWKPTCKLRPASFLDTGRGIMTREKIRPNDVLVSIPKNLLINSHTALASHSGEVFKNLCDQNYPTTQQILSTFLVDEKKLCAKSSWFEYISTIPSSFSTPLFCDKNEVLPSYIASQVEAMRDSVIQAHQFVVARQLSQGLPSQASWPDFLWAWSAVNSRAVFLDQEGSSVVRGKDSMALAPFLDLLNHSPSIGPNTVCCLDNYYQLRSSAHFNKYDQVFISYGPHDNLTLCLEYGFVIPDNQHDFVSISRQEICKTLGQTFVSEAGPEICCTREGLGWHGLTFIAERLRIPIKDLYRQSQVSNAARLVVEMKVRSLQQQLQDMSLNVAPSESFSVVKALLQEHINLLKWALASQL